MIIGLTRDTCEIGDIIEGTYRLTETEDITVKFRVLGKATYEEWLAYRESEGRPISHDTNFQRAGYTFYKVHTD